MVIWLIGLSSAGKTAIGRKLYEIRKQRDAATVLVDGDEIRRLFRTDRTPADYSLEGRRDNAERMVELCAWLDSQSIDVVCCILCIFPDVLAENRRRFENYFEVFVDVPIEVAERRDVKNLYAPARRGETTNVVGIDMPFPIPEAPDMTVDNSADDVDIDALAVRISEAADRASR